VTHLRQAMLDELQRRNYAKTTVQYYIQAVEGFARHFHRPPDQLNQTLCSPKTPELCSPTFGAVLRELSSWKYKGECFFVSLNRG
jgi:Phage integrase, N-terminal SAM-like domain